jgi:hypothetical protein
MKGELKLAEDQRISDDNLNFVHLTTMADIICFMKLGSLLMVEFPCDCSVFGGFSC